MQEATVQLGYWPIRGLAERIRLLLEYLGIPYSQVRYQGPQAANRWFKEDKPKLCEKNPAVTLPYLVDGDKVVSQSDAILVYLAFKGGKPHLLGKDREEQVQLATVYGVFKDFHPNYIRLVYGSYNENSTFATALEESHKSFDPYLKKLSGLLGSKEYFCGNLTVIDFTLADSMQTIALLSPKYLEAYPNLVAHQKRIWGLPELQGYFSSERFRERPCNGGNAAWK